MLKFYLVFGFFGCILAENIDVDLTADRTQWIDPTDPFAFSSYCSKSATDLLDTCNSALENCLKHHVSDIVIMYFDLICSSFSTSNALTIVFHSFVANVWFVSFLFLSHKLNDRGAKMFARI